uniref:Fe2OG dioxygenase domain-containing protein n=1 Tax=Plectus sambesii TaxID=2011161 RepID=A0A914XQW4_9BILA
MRVVAPTLLSYEEGGHYVPHYDYLDVPPNPMDYDSWMRHLGNRMATLFLILQRAAEGGGTIFPYLSLTVQPEPGDAMLWFNMNVDGSRDDGTLHGGCPIRAGNKLAMTLWIREKGQELRVKCPRFPNQMRFDLTSLSLG